MRSHISQMTDDKASKRKQSIPQQSRQTDRVRQASSQFSLSNFVGNLSGRSLVSVTSNQSVYSASRPWSRVSRRRWNDESLKKPLEASKTVWPIAHKESIFLPEFPISTDLLQKDFEIIRTIAKGAFGEVYQVKKINENKDYALKVLSKSQVVNENAVRQVKEEARIQAACGHHTFIASAVSRWQTKKRLYIVSEYIPCGELLDLLDKYGKLPEELVKIFVAEIAIVIDFLHNAGVIFRDLKPENILLDPDYHVKLIDFGLSKWLSIGARTTTFCGTLKYMAPEVSSREPYNHAADWWSLGVVSCRMLTGEFPTPALQSQAKSESENENDGDIKTEQKSLILVDRQRNSNRPGKLPESAAKVSKAALGLLLRLLEPDPKVRMRNLRQLQQSAFYMGFNFEHVKTKMVSPRNILERYLSQGILKSQNSSVNIETFAEFDQSAII